MPQLPETWSNEQVLSFVRMMWRNWGKKRAANNGEGNNNDGDGGESSDVEEAKGPAPPAAVAAAAKIALASLGSEPTKALYVEPLQTETFNDTHGETHSPLVPKTAALVERTMSGRLQVPPSTDTDDTNGFVEAWTEAAAVGRPAASTFNAAAPGGYPDGPPDNPEQRNRNLRWLKTHFRPLIELGQLAFNNADMWQLHQYYFSPPYFDDDESVRDKMRAAKDIGKRSNLSLDLGKIMEGENSTDNKLAATTSSLSVPVSGMKKSASMGRPKTTSYRSLSTALLGSVGERHSKRTHDDDEDEDAENNDDDMMTEPPAAKRSKSMKPRIAYYPRIRVRQQCQTNIQFLFPSSVIFISPHPSYTYYLV